MGFQITMAFRGPRVPISRNFSNGTLMLAAYGSGSIGRE